MITPYAYSPPPPPLREVRPTIALGFLVVPAAVAMAFANPIVLAGCALTVAVCARGAASTAAAAGAAKGAAALAVLIVVVNGLVVRRGETVVFRGGEVPLIGRLDVTSQALLEGAIIGARVAIVIAAFAVVTARVDPDYLLRSVRRFAGRSSLTATLLIRLVPLAVSDLGRLREARALRGPGAAPVTRLAIARQLVSGTLERASESAAALEVRGYSRPAPRLQVQRTRRRNDRFFAVAAVGAAAIAVAARIAGAGEYDPYPATFIDTGALTIGLAICLPLISWLPFAARRGEL